jgi:hypothetical protein
MYISPLTAPEVKHNFLLLKDKFDLFNPDCPDCYPVCETNDITYEIPFCETNDITYQIL